MTDATNNDSTQTDKMIGWCIIGCFSIALLGAILAVLSMVGEVDFSSSGLCLIAPAIALGLLAHAIVGR